MKKQYIKSCFTIFVLIILCWNVAAFTQQDFIDQQRMNRDLRIMEGILDKLLQGNISVYYNVSGQTKAVYLPEFGIVFYTKQSLFPYTVSQVALPNQETSLQEALNNLIQMREQMTLEMEVNSDIKNEIQDRQNALGEKIEKVTDILNVQSEQMVQKKEETIEKLKENMVVFFRNYTSAIGQLQSQDKLVVLVDLKNSQPGDSKNNVLIGWVLKQDVDRYRQGQIDESGFEGRVHFQSGDSESDIDTDIGILLEIFDRAMDSSSYWANSSNTGVYLEGLGALIVLELPRTIGSNVFMPHLQGVDENNALFLFLSQRMDEKEEESEENENDYIENIQNELFELLASYGHTLRLQPQEWVVLNANLGSRFIGFTNEEKTPSFFVLKLKKKDLDDYNRGAITLSTLKGRLVQQTF